MDAGMKVEKVDFAIITILPEEFIAVQKRFAPKRYKHPASSHTYGISYVQTKSGQTCVGAIARTSRQGNDASQQLATQIITDLDPQILLVVGIGGGVPDTDFTLGDVIVSSHIHNFDLNAIKGHQTTFDVSGGIHPVVSDITANLYLYHDQMADWNSEASIGLARPALLLTKERLQGSLDKGIDLEWCEKVVEALLWHFDEKQRGKRSPIFLTGTIASSNSLIRSDEVLAQWLQSARSIRAVEMEAAGVYQAAQRMRQQYPVMAIRGISDIVGFKRGDDWKQYACHTAAAFVHAFIAAGIVEPREQTVSPPSIEPPVQPPPSPQEENEDMPRQTINIFIIYASADKQHKERLVTQLSPYVRSKLMMLWDIDRVRAGEDVSQELRRFMAFSRIILLLVSPTFTASEHCIIEMEDALRQQAAGKAVVIPIYIRPIDWPDAPFKAFVPLPRNRKPVISWSSADEAWHDVAKDIRKACEAERDAF